MKVCTVDGCDMKQESHGLCNRHYHRLRRRGDPQVKDRRIRARWQRIDLGDGVIRIRLTQGHVAIADAADFMKIARHSWNASQGGNGEIYARTYIGGRSISLQRYLLDAEDSEEVDHRNGDTLDYRRANLRRATGTENSRNRRIRLGTETGFKGVKREPSGRYRAQISYNGKRHSLGTFDTVEQGAAAYDDAAREHFGEFACTNFPIGNERPARLGQS